MARRRTIDWEMCRQFSMWWTGGERDDVFMKTVGSGTQFTQRFRRRGKGHGDAAFQGGDMTVSDPIGAPLIETFSIEFKYGYSKKKKSEDAKKKIITNWCVLDPIDTRQSKPVILEMWNQTIRDAEATNRLPMLVFRRPNFKACICVNNVTWKNLVRFFAEPNCTNISLHLKTDTIRIMGLNEFFEWIPDIRPFLEDEPLCLSKQSCLKTSKPKKKPRLISIPD